MEIIRRGKFILVREFNSESSDDLKVLSDHLEYLVKIKEEIIPGFPVRFRKMETPVGLIEKTDFILIVREKKN